MTTFNAALPYGVGTLAVGALGVGIIFSSTSTAAIVAGIALAIIGSYAFIGVIGCGIAHSGDPNGFRDNVWKCMGTTAGVGIRDIIAFTVKEVVFGLIQEWLSGRRQLRFG